ncbi:MAG: exopolysaccharide Pel transporter PelG, partial [Calditrichaeota bacterium]|nr:exopolysaccharide Pel transporter PelG [Calditrichota bacterium]
MAGIGFELQKLIKKGTYLSYLKAFLYGTVLSSGPWLTTTAALILIGFYTGAYAAEGSARLLTVTVIYAYAFSLILTGPWQNTLIRFIADRVFLKKPEQIVPGYRTASLPVLALGLLVGLPAVVLMRFYVSPGNTLLFRVAALFLLLTLSELWMLMSYVSTSRNYQQVFVSFLVGSAASFGLAVVLMKRADASWALLGYLTGQLIILVLLFLIGEREFDGKGWWEPSYFRCLKPYRHIALAGLFYNAGVWVDKIVVWFTLGQVEGASIFRSCNTYDVPAFLAFLSMVPGLAYFLIIAETTFYQSYRRFVDSVLRDPLVLIDSARIDMLETAQKGMLGLAKFQGVFTLALFILAPQVLKFTGYGWVSVNLFRILLFGAFANVLFLNVVILMLYLELREEAAVTTLLFFVANAGLTLFSVRWGATYLGWSYLVAAA